MPQKLATNTAKANAKLKSITKLMAAVKRFAADHKKLDSKRKTATIWTSKKARDMEQIADMHREAVKALQVEEHQYKLLTGRAAVVALQDLSELQLGPLVSEIHSASEQRACDRVLTRLQKLASAAVAEKLQTTPDASEESLLQEAKRVYIEAAESEMLYAPEPQRAQQLAESAVAFFRAEEQKKLLHAERIATAKAKFLQRLNGVQLGAADSATIAAAKKHIEMWLRADYGNKNALVMADAIVLELREAADNAPQV